MYKPIRRVDLVEGGTVIRQGDYFTLGLQPFDSNGEIPDLSDKVIVVVIAQGYKIFYETTADFRDNVIYFTVDDNIGSGTFNVELTVTDSSDESYKHKYPADDSLRITLTPSTDDLEKSGAGVITVAMLKDKLRAIQEDYEVRSDERIDNSLTSIEEVRINTEAERVATENVKNETLDAKNATEAAAALAEEKAALAQSKSDLVDERMAELEEVDAVQFDSRLNSVTQQLADIAYNIKSFGAVGDGVTDDTSAIQSAIDTVASLGGGNVVLPTGTFIAQGITPKPNVTLVGVPYGTVLKLKENPTDHLITYNGDVQIEGFNLFNIKFKGDNAKTKNLINFTRIDTSNLNRDWYNSIVSGCWFENANIGVFASNPGTIRFVDCTFRYNDIGANWDWEHFYFQNCLITWNRIGLLFGTNTKSPFAIHFMINNTVFGHNTEYSIYGNCHQAGILNCSFIGDGIAHIVLKATSTRIVGNRLIGTTKEMGILIKQEGSRKSEGCTISNNIFDNHGKAIDISGESITIQGNVFRYNDKCIEITRGENLIISGNSFKETNLEAVLIAGLTAGLNIVGNNFLNGSRTTANGADGIRLVAGQVLIASSITGNSFNDIGTAKTRYAINLFDGSGSSADVVLSSNVARNMATSGYRIKATGMTQGLNIGTVLTA